MRRVALALVLLVTTACRDARRESIDVGFRVRTPVRGQDGALEDRPLEGADRLSTWVERGDGQKVDDSERMIALPATRVSLPPLPFEGGLTLRVDAYDGTTLLSRGRSLPFEVSAVGATPAPDLFVSSLGRFARRISPSPSAPVTVLLPTAYGALFILADGRVARLSPFATTPIVMTSTNVGAGAEVVSVGERFLAAFSTATKSLTLISPEGDIAATLSSAPLARHGDGVMLAADPAGDVLLLVGGDADVASELGTAVSRIDVPADVTALTATALAPLPTTRWAGSITWVEGSPASAARALVLGGQSDTSAADALLIDPRGAGTVRVLPGVDVGGASVVAMGAGQVLIVGGSGASDVRLLIVATEPPSLTLAAPSPPALASPRTGPILVRCAPQIVLVLGGVNAGALVRSAELVDLRVFPGSTVQTGELPASIVDPRAARLRDHSVWVLDTGGVLGYVPPRGE